ncbi:NADPH-dependent 7-cyano-7-deazaguanine reductase [Campylobacter majalis]|uniref:NADPH-dependent 7-cyano-7-deazaguanine reductase n=1 Tax=Campylobacter majalis TaxID=2790656 RepID=A0ABN7KAM0_9BACT|nr:preQ(1) synthase [Campylobacter majalis]CAD7288776.1 NADPH-dependent 7-cyano-7-deazaguanine reductase [Campylobacter majalis]
MSENLQLTDTQQMKYGEREIKEFDVEKDLEIWPNKHQRDYTIRITLPEFCCLCPRSGYPDFATIYIDYIPNKWVVELKAIKLYINSFMNRNISHEDSINEIFEVLQTKLEPKFLKIVGDFNPRGNVHTVIEITNKVLTKQSEISNEIKCENYRAGARRIDEREKDKKRDNSRSFDNKDTKSAKSGDKKHNANKDGFRKISFQGDKKPIVVKKDS